MSRALIVVDYQNDFVPPDGALAVPDGDEIAARINELTDLAALLRDRGIGELTIVGLATDYCVKHTALEGLREGFAVTVDSTAVRGVEVQPGDSRRALEEIRAAGAAIA